MAKMIRLPDSKIVEITNALKKHKMLDGKFEIKEVFDYNDNKHATLRFTPIAYIKMIKLVMDFDKEVAWHGVVKRDPEDETVFIVTDILVYPQEVTAVTVDMDELEYQKWTMQPEVDSVFNDMRLQGHSHVNMSVNPSGTDLNTQKKFLDDLKDDSFYIFIIINKSMSREIKIVDVKNNIIYENKEVNTEVEGLDLHEFGKVAKDMVKTSKPIGYSTTTTPSGGYSYISSNYSYNTSPAYRNNYAWDDDDDDYMFKGYSNMYTADKQTVSAPAGKDAGKKKKKKK